MEYNQIRVEHNTIEAYSEALDKACDYIKENKDIAFKLVNPSELRSYKIEIIFEPCEPVTIMCHTEYYVNELGF